MMHDLFSGMSGMVQGMELIWLLLILVLILGLAALAKYVFFR